MMTREEAIEVLRRTTEYFKKDKDFRFREAVETLIPEFNETEDERIRKHLIEVTELYWGTTNDPDKAKDMDWLERHKDPQTPGIEIGKSYKCIASPRFTCFRKGEVYVVEDEWMAKLFSISEGCFEADDHPKEHKFNVGDTIRLKNSYAEYTIESISGGRYYCKGCSIDIDGCDADYELVQQKPILEVFGFKVGDAVRLKDGDGRKHIIKSFEEVEGVHGPNFYHVEFEDDSASDGIYPGEEYPNGYYTKMEKIEEEQKPADLPPGFYFIDQYGKKYYSKEFRFGDMKMKVVENESEKPVWSDEDKKIVETICKEGDLKPSEQRWLKSLPERFVLQPQQEWSEEDEKMVELLIAIFEVNHPNGFFKANGINTTDMRGVYTDEIISWLKSLRKNRKACDVDEFSLTLRNCLYVDSELTHEQADAFARAYGEELYKVALGEIKTGLDKEDIEEYKLNSNPGDTRDRKSVEWDEDELSRYALTKAYEAYPMSVRNICNNEWNAKRDGYRHGYEQAVKELSLPKPNKEGC